MRWLGLSITLLQCGAPSAPPEQAVVGFFAGVERRSCPDLRARAGGELAKGLGDSCKELFAETERRGGLSLVRIDKVATDGRDRNARLVHAVIRTGGHDKSVILRVEARSGQWRLMGL